MKFFYLISLYVGKIIIIIIIYRKYDCKWNLDKSNLESDIFFKIKQWIFGKLNIFNKKDFQILF